MHKEINFFVRINSTCQKITNRFVSLICIFSMMLAMLPSVAFADDGYDLKQAEEVLKKLNILSNSKINHDTYVYSLAGFLYENPTENGSAEEIARATGMVDSNEKYVGSDTITVEEAIKYAVTILGYKKQAQLQGGYPNGYKKIASDLKISRGISLKDGNILNKNDAIRLIYQMIDVNPMVSYYNGESDSGYAVNENETLLSLNRDIYKISGLLTATSDTSIYKEEGAPDNTIVIDGIEYDVLNDSDNAYLGYNVEAYVRQEKNDNGKLICVNEYKNQTLEIAAEDIEEISEDFSHIKYENSSEEIKTAKLYESPKIIYNGVYYGDYTVEDLMPDIGNLFLIDNNRDGKYDVVLVMSYETMIVESVDAEEETVNNRYKFDKSIQSLELNSDERKISYSIFKGNLECKFEDIKIDDILSVARSRNEDKQKVEILISDFEKISGRVTKIDYEENELSIDNEIYKISDDFIKFKTNAGKILEVGSTYMFYIDAFENIAYMKYIDNSDYKLMLKVYEEDEKYYMVYMDLNEEWTTAPFADRVDVDGKKYKAYYAYKAICENDPQMVVIKENAAKEIKYIDTAIISAKYNENEFTKTEPASYIYRSEPKSLAMNIWLDDAAKIVVFPEDVTMDRTKYYVRDANGYFQSNQTYSITAYDLDKFSFTKLLSTKESENEMANRVNKGLFIVTSVSEVCVDDEVLAELTGNMGEYKNMTVIGAHSNVFDGVEAGDVLNINLNSEGRANYKKKIYSLSDYKQQGASNYYAESLVIAGTIEDMDFEESKIKINCGTSSITCKISGNKTIQMYTAQRKKCDIKTADTLKLGDKLVCRLRYGNLEEIVCVREK